jgi:hypothetical protein
MKELMKAMDIKWDVKLNLASMTLLYLKPSNSYARCVTLDKAPSAKESETGAWYLSFC